MVKSGKSLLEVKKVKHRVLKSSIWVMKEVWSKNQTKKDDRYAKDG